MQAPPVESRSVPRPHVFLVYLEPSERIYWLQMLFYFCKTISEKWRKCVFPEFSAITYKNFISVSNTPSYGLAQNAETVAAMNNRNNLA